MPFYGFFVMGWEYGSKISKDMKFDRAVNRISTGWIIDWIGLLLKERKWLVIKYLSTHRIFHSFSELK